MDSDITLSIVKELEKINISRSKYSYRGAWATLFVSIVYLTYLFFKSLGPITEKANVWVYVLFFVIALLLMLQSFYVILSHIINKKLSIIIKSILDLGKLNNLSK